MTVALTTSLTGPYVPNGVTTVFPFFFEVGAANELAVIIDGVTVTPGNYNVTLAPGNEGGSVTFTVAPTGAALYLASNPSFQQQIAFQNAGPFLAESHDEGLDRSVIRDIYLRDKVNRAIRVPLGEVVTEVPPLVDRQSKYLVFDMLGNPITSFGTGNDPALRADLAAAGGSALVAFSHQATGSVARFARDKMGEVVSPKDFGAVGDGVANDTTAVTNALTYAFNTGRVVDGGDGNYNVSGSLVFTSKTRPWIRALQLKQTDPVNGRVTLKFMTCTGIRIDRLKIDVGNGATTGDMNSTFGLWIDGGSGHKVRNVEVIGNGKLTMLGVWNVTQSNFDNLYVHDNVFNDNTVTDDVVQGIWFNACTDCTINTPVVANLTGNASYVGTPFANLRTRGICLSGCLRVSVVDPKITNVEQGIDLTGSAGNRQCTVIGGTTFECGSVGVKFSNSAVDCKCIGHTANRIGMYAFLAAGPAEAGLTYKTMDCDFVACKAIDVGYNGISLTNKAGFEVIAGDFDTLFPKGIRFIDCQAYDRQGVATMKYGFYNNVPYDASAKKPNEVINGTSIGHVTASQTGFHRYLARLNGGSTFSLANNSELPIQWNNTREDTTLMHSDSVNPERITVPVAGLYRVRCRVLFAANGTGTRRANIRLDGVAQLEDTVGTPSAGGITTIQLDDYIDCPAGGVLAVYAYQNSGGALNIDRSTGYFQAQMIRAT